MCSFWDSRAPRRTLRSIVRNLPVRDAYETYTDFVHQFSLDYIVQEPELFHLNMKGAYHTLNSSLTPDQELDDAIDRIVSGIFSVIATMGVIPIISA